MTLVETQHRLALEQLRRAGEQPVSLAALRAAGLDAPAAVITELELNGHAIERVYEYGLLLGLRLIEPQDADTVPGVAAIGGPGGIASGPLSSSRGSFATAPGHPAADTLILQERRVPLIITDVAEPVGSAGGSDDRAGGLGFGVRGATPVVVWWFAQLSDFDGGGEAF